MCFNRDATNNCHFLQQMYLITIFGIIVKIPQFNKSKQTILSRMQEMAGISKSLY